MARELAILQKEHLSKQDRIRARLAEFKHLPTENYFDEFIFCLLTPQSKGQSCWEAVLQIKKLTVVDRDALVNVLKSKTRFHNHKADYVLKAYSQWSALTPLLSNPHRKILRDSLAEEVKGYGLKEAGHFLRNIGKSDNQFAILDRHILRNLHALGVTTKESLKNRQDYLETEKKFLAFSEKINIPIDELDLLFWSRENGEIFK